MAEATDNFVEIDGVKYKEDPENEGQALIGDDKELVPFEEKEEEEEEEKEPKEKEEKKEEEKKEEEEEPPVRKSAKDYIIERKNKKIEKLEKEKEEEDEWGEEKVTPEGKRAIEEEIERKVKPILQTVRTQSDEQELKDVFAKYPDASEMEKDIRKYMEHEKYQGVSIEFIFLGLAAKKMKLQEQRKKADEEAKGEKTGGHEKRKKDLGPIPDVRDMSDADVDKLVHKVKTGQFST